jgi:hypothetical protein
MDWLRENYATATRGEITKRFPNRTMCGIQQQANRKIGLTRNADVAFTRQNVFMRQLTPEELAYFAGIIDGEGHISLVKSRKKHRGKIYTLYVPTLGVTNQSEKLVLWMSERIRWTIHSLNPNKGEWGWAYRPAVCGHGVKPLLEALLPYLVVKRRQAELLIQFIEMRGKKTTSDRVGKEEIAIREEIMALNLRRKSPSSALKA